MQATLMDQMQTQFVVMDQRLNNKLEAMRLETRTKHVANENTESVQHQLRAVQSDSSDDDRSLHATETSANRRVQADVSSTTGHDDAWRWDEAERKSAAEFPSDTGQSLSYGEEMKRLLEGIADYVVKDGMLGEKRTITHEVTLKPTKQILRFDTVVQNVLKGIQKGNHIVPPSHDEIRFPFTHGDKLQAQKEYLTELLTKRFSEILKVNLQNNTTALTPLIIQKCVSAALNMKVTNPIFMGQCVLEAVRTTRKAKKVWITHRFDYIREDESMRPIHILDLYTDSWKGTGVAHTFPHRDMVRAVQEHKMADNETAAAFVREHFSLLHDLFRQYSYSATPSSCPNTDIIAVLMATATRIYEAVPEHHLFRRKMKDDYNRKKFLPWNVWVTERTDVAKLLERVRARWVQFAEEVDFTIEIYRAATRTQTAGQSKNARADGRNSRKQAKKYRQKSKLKSHMYQTDTGEICTSPYCKKKQYEEHKVGAKDDCGRICKLHLRNIECPSGNNKLLDGRHLFTKSCKSALEKHKQK